MGFSRQEYWNGLPFPSPGDLPSPGIKPMSPTLAGRFFFYHWTTMEAQIEFYLHLIWLFIFAKGYEQGSLAPIYLILIFYIKTNLHGNMAISIFPSFQKIGLHSAFEIFALFLLNRPYSNGCKWCLASLVYILSSSIQVHLFFFIFFWSLISDHTF